MLTVQKSSKLSEKLVKKRFSKLFLSQDKIDFQRIV